MNIGMEEFLRMLAERSRPRPEKLTSEKLQHELVSKQILESYSQQLRQIYDHFFNDRKNELEIDKCLPFKLRKTEVPLCNKLLNRSEGVYKCYECFIHQAAVLCEQCFQKGHHEGHRFKKFPSGGGNCDCGNQLALKKEGFCIHHTGTVKRPEIKSEQRQLFHYIIGYMLQWFFKLKNSKQPFAETFGTVLIKYLHKLNKQSILYNILTHELFTKKSNQGTTCLSEFLKIKKGRMPEALNELFFEMFTLDQFKLALANEYLIAYNTLVEFEGTSFHHLYIQLFANDNIVIDLANQYKNTICVTKNYYDEETYLSDLHFISTINQKPACAFYETYFEKNKIIPLNFLNEIEKLFEKQHSMHEVDVVTRYLNNQYFFYTINEDLFAKIGQHQQIQVKIVKELFLGLISKKHSYRRNKAVLPYHRTYALGLFTIFQGNISKISIKGLIQKLNLEQKQVKDFYLETTSHIVNCMLDFAETYCRRNYFDNYIVLYARQGVSCLRFDQLFLKEAASIFKSAELTFQPILTSKFLANTKVVMFDEDPTNIAEFLEKWISFGTLIVEIGATQINEVMFNSKLNLNNTDLQRKKRQLFKSIIRKSGQVSKQQITTIEKNFTGTLDDKFLLENTEFDRATKKYQAKIEKQEKEAPQFLYEICVSKRKAGLTMFKESDGKPFIARQIKVSQRPQLLDILLPKSFINQMINFFCQNISKVEVKRSQSIVTSLMSLLKKLSIFSSQSYSEQMAKVSKFFRQQILPEQNQKQNQNLRKEQIKKTQNQKKARLMMKQQKVLKLLENKNPQLAGEAQNEDLLCILCRGNNTEGLSYFSVLKYKRLMSSGKQNKLGYVYSSCFHTAHYECFKKLIKNNSIANCPLCKAPCNILLPVVCDFDNETFRQIMERIRVLTTYLAETFGVKKSKQESKFNVFESMMECLVEYIGFVGVFNQAELKRKFWRICKQILKLMIKEWDIFNGNQRQELYNMMGKYIDSENKNRDLIVNFKHCIVSVIFTHIQGKQAQVQKIQQAYKNKINYQDLKIIKENLILVLGQHQEIEQEISVTGSDLPRLQSLYNFYQPPLTIKELIKERDQKSLKNCKKGHSVCICLECQQLACVECKTIDIHNKLHGNEVVYFCFQTGGLNICLNVRMTSPSLYENKLGDPWTTQKQPEGFELNGEGYKQAISNMIIHNIEEFTRKRKLKKLDLATTIFTFEAD